MIETLSDHPPIGKNLIIMAILGAISLASWRGLQDTVATGKSVFGMTEDTPLKWYIYLYYAMKIGQLAVAGSLLMITSGWVRELLGTILSVVLLIAFLDAHRDISQDPLRYLEPSRYQRNAATRTYLAQATDSAGTTSAGQQRVIWRVGSLSESAVRSENLGPAPRPTG